MADFLSFFKNIFGGRKKSNRSSGRKKRRTTGKRVKVSGRSKSSRTGGRSGGGHASKKKTKKPRKRKSVGTKKISPGKKRTGSGSSKVAKVRGVKEKEVGVVTHFFSKISVGAVKLKAPVKVGDKIHIKGAHDDFYQIITSMQVDRRDVSSAGRGDEIGIKVKQKVHENDRVYRVVEG